MLFTAAQLLVLLVVTIALATTLAHALEFPGKLRLSRRAYFETQKIYYPGFTVAGIAEPLACLALVLLAGFSLVSGDFFLLTALAAAGFLIAHAVYWFLIHPVNKVWVKDPDLDKAGGGFFGFGKGTEEADWRVLRDRWEYSHMVRAILMLAAFMLFAVAIATS